jgi:hypothetical protein
MPTPSKICEKAKFLKSERGTWETHWQELGDYIIPSKNDITRTRVPGEKIQQQIYDNTAMHSNVLLAGFLHSLLTNPNSQFFELTTGFEEIDSRDDVRRWLQKQSRKMLHVLNNSNFQTEIHELYIDLGAFGTSIMSVEEDKKSIVRFQTRPLRGCYLEEDFAGQVSEVYREFEWSAAQMVQAFGAEVLTKHRDIAKAYQAKDTKKFMIVHGVYPSGDTGESRFSYKSLYALREGEIELQSGGFSSFPYICPRWMKHSGEKYGRSPGMVALPEVKTINIMVETTIKGAQKVVDPPLQVPDDGFIGMIRTRPASLNFYRSGTTDRIEPIFNDARIDFGIQVIEEKRQRIRDSFYVDQLRLRQGTPQMTATEVEQRVEEALRFMGPILGRQQSETLRPIIDRVYEIMEKRGMIDPAPDILKRFGGKLDVNYSSLIARTQRQNESKAILRAVEQATPFISADPSVLDNLDGNVALKKIWKINNADQEIVRSDAEVRRIREQRAQQQQLAMEEQLKLNTSENISKTVPALAKIGG